ncbi:MULTISPECIES: fumarylacetoacetate hydrolase family protein [unclassified Streptomyces]|uniref:fumarylacetoacetate hydrolase family protein n=1 Tax=unclassified Streptomyces TaxID=2593676 RepID=UPI001F0EC5D9|nr:fumarylacetoacetate hydrolase family protein [Streptomyces sp. DASNCL29]
MSWSGRLQCPASHAPPIECRINGEVMQRSSTKQLIFSVPRLMEHLSAVLPLMPGDVVFTGTPAGIGGARKPARFLLEGDVVETRISGIGELRQVCVPSAETGERQVTT